VNPQWGRGRLALAEDLLTKARDQPGLHAALASQKLANIRSPEGRVDEVRPLFKELGMDRDPAVVLIRLWKLDNDPYTIEGLRMQLEDAARKAPDDDRVWLGLARSWVSAPRRVTRDSGTSERKSSITPGARLG
jgi:hypothetical protein